MSEGEGEEKGMGERRERERERGERRESAKQNYTKYVLQFIFMLYMSIKC